MGNLLNVLSGTRSQSAISLATRFEKDNGTFILTDTGATRFESNMVNGIDVGGRLSINTNDVKKLASSADVSYDQALKQIAVHELGHYNYAAQDAHNLAFTPEQKESWCYQREGEATYFSYLASQEARANGFPRV